LWCYFSIHFLHWRVDERLSGINWRNWKVILNNLSIYKKLTFLCSLAMVDFYLIRMSNVRETFSFILDSCQRCFTCFMVWTNIPLVLVESFPKSRGSNYICEVGKHITQILSSHYIYEENILWLRAIKLLHSLSYSLLKSYWSSDGADVSWLSAFNGDKGC
jgi:hypothetical protein